jgi:hypothetical protein
MKTVSIRIYPMRVLSRGAPGAAAGSCRIGRGAQRATRVASISLRDVDTGDICDSHFWTAADCDGVGAASERREGYWQYGAK